jgi:hypothetical protein
MLLSGTKGRHNAMSLIDIGRNPQSISLAGP